MQRSHRDHIDMLNHHNPVPQSPKRVVVIGSGGFVGGALLTRLMQAHVPVLPIDRAKVDLLQIDAAETLAGLLRSSDAVVAVAAIAPVKNTRMLADNMRLVATIMAALGKVRVAHVVNISSHALYPHVHLPLPESSPQCPTSPPAPTH